MRPGAREAGGLPAKRSQWLVRQGRPHSGGTARDFHPLPYSPAQPHRPAGTQPFSLLSYSTEKRFVNLFEKSGEFFCTVVLWRRKRTKYTKNKENFFSK